MNHAISHRAERRLDQHDRDIQLMRRELDIQLRRIGQLQADIDRAVKCVTVEIHAHKLTGKPPRKP